jgi:hypothetical protein
VEPHAQLMGAALDGVGDGRLDGVARGNRPAPPLGVGSTPQTRYSKGRSAREAGEPPDGPVGSRGTLSREKRKAPQPRPPPSAGAKSFRPLRGLVVTRPSADADPISFPRVSLIEGYGRFLANREDRPTTGELFRERYHLR